MSRLTELTDFMGSSWRITVSRLDEPDEVYQFADPKFIGRSYVLGPDGEILLKLLKADRERFANYNVDDRQVIDHILGCIDAAGARNGD